MKYVAIIESDNELSEDIIEKMKDTIFVGYEEYPSNDNAKYSFTIENIMKAPEPRGKLKRIAVEDFWERAGYNRALKDCGVIEE